MTNAADSKEVKEADKKERSKKVEEKEDLKILLGVPAFRKFIWRVLTYCSVFESIWHPSALIHHNSGRQDCGHWIMGEITRADEGSFIKLMSENKKEQDDND